MPVHLRCRTTAPAITRWVLAWFLLALGVATAAPLVQPKPWVLVCSASGVVALVALQDDEGASTDGAATSTGGLHHTLDCAFCLPGGAPPPILAWTPAESDALPHVLLPVEAARIAALVGAPLPARGPPDAAA
jgi:Protein of unknown function (DUF2946)